MRIFISGTSFHGSYGGPAVSVPTLAVALAKAGARVTIWAPDGSAPASPILAGQPGVEPIKGSFRDVWTGPSGADVVHDNGIWMPHNHAIARAFRRNRLPRVVSVRGMLEPWAFDFHRTRKRLAWRLYQRRDLKTAACLHATSDAEAINLQSFDLGPPITVIPNGIDIAKPAKARRISDKPQRTALFLGRMHPMKGLPLLLRAWAQVRPAGWSLRIVGPDELGHAAELRALARSLRIDDAVFFEPPVGRAESAAVAASSDLLVLCSHSENFGMSVVEALLQEVPVLTSRGTPWSSVVESRCGWWVDTSVEALSAGLREATSRSVEERLQMGRRGREMVEREFSSTAVAERFLLLYEELIRKAGES